MSIVYPKLAVIGCGLIGSSVILAARAAGVVESVHVADLNPEHRAEIERLGYADAVFADAAQAVRDADLVVLATPPLSIAAAALAAGPGLKRGATITDVGSVKGGVGETLAAAADGVFAIPGHPIAGTEKSGPAAGFAALFQNRWTILCPSDRQEPDYLAAVERLTAFWTALGAKVETMDDKHHDLVLAITSHLPHLIAYNIVGTAADLEEVTRGEVIKFSASGFRDFTRIAASDPTMWRDVFLMNKDAVLEILGRFTEDLQALSRAIRWGEGGQALRSVQPHPRHPPQRHRRRPGKRRAQLRPRPPGLIHPPHRRMKGGDGDLKALDLAQHQRTARRDLDKADDLHRGHHRAAGLMQAVEHHLEIITVLAPAHPRHLQGVVTQDETLFVGVDGPAPLVGVPAHIAVGFVQMKRPVLLRPTPLHLQGEATQHPAKAAAHHPPARQLSLEKIFRGQGALLLAEANYTGGATSRYPRGGAAKQPPCPGHQMEFDTALDPPRTPSMRPPPFRLLLALWAAPLAALAQPAPTPAPAAIPGPVPTQEGKRGWCRSWRSSAAARVRRFGE